MIHGVSYDGGMHIAPYSPHEIDRYRILEELASHVRRRVGLTQSELARRTGGVSQPTVGALENLSRSPSSGARRRRVSRANAFKVLAHGLRLSANEVNVVLWLLDGRTLTPFEQNYVATYDPEARQVPSVEQLRSGMVAMMQRAIAEGDEDRHTAEVKIRFNADEQSRLRETEELLGYERQPGRRLLISRNPSSLTHPLDGFDVGQMVHLNITSREGIEKARKIHRERQERFLSNLEQYGERCIHSRADLVEYIARDGGFRLHRRQRVLQVENLIGLMERFDHFEIGLAEATPQLEVGVKFKVVAVLRGAPRAEEVPSPTWGLHHIFWCDELSIFFFLVHFEQRWGELAAVNVDKRHVIGWLRQLVEKHPL